MAMFGLREGPWPRAVVTTTPKRRAFVRDLAQAPGTIVVRARTYDNPHLPERAVKRLEERYGGTTLGRQELLAEDIGDLEGAMWQRAWIEDTRVTKLGEACQRIVVAVDPAGTHRQTSDQTAICVAGLGWDGEFYVLHSESGRLTPSAWATRVVALYREYAADKIVAEVNYGGDMVVATIEGVWPAAPVERVVASRGKAIRAEPIASLYEQGRVHHVGLFPDLEDQMCSFPLEGSEDDELDAAVWALTALSGTPQVFPYLYVGRVSGWGFR